MAANICQNCCCTARVERTWGSEARFCGTWRQGWSSGRSEGEDYFSSTYVGHQRRGHCWQPCRFMMVYLFCYLAGILMICLIILLLRGLMTRSSHDCNYLLLHRLATCHLAGRDIMYYVMTWICYCLELWLAIFARQRWILPFVYSSNEWLNLVSVLCAGMNWLSIIRAWLNG